MKRTDAELLAAARSDPQAFREFYERHAVAVRSYHHRHTGSEAAALDLTAETFAQAWRGIRRFRDLADGSGGPWLYGIARNLLRQYHKHNRIETNARGRLGLPIEGQQTDEFEAVVERESAAALARPLAAAMNALPADQRAAIQLRVLDDLSYDEVAGQLGCSQNAARLRVSRALRTIGAALGGAA